MSLACSLQSETLGTVAVPLLEGDLDDQTYHIMQPAWCSATVDKDLLRRMQRAAFDQDPILGLQIDDRAPNSEQPKLDLIAPLVLDHRPTAQELAENLFSIMLDRSTTVEEFEELMMAHEGSTTVKDIEPQGTRLLFTLHLDVAIKGIPAMLKEFVQNFEEREARHQLFLQTGPAVVTYGTPSLMGSSR